MSFILNKEQKLFQQMISEFAKNEIQPIAAQIDKTEEFPYETVEKMAQNQLMGIPFEEKYGGAGGDYLSYIVAVNEISRYCATTGVILSAHTSLGAGCIDEFGNEAQKQQYLIPLAKGNLIGGFALTEPNAGTDAAGQQTTAVKVGDEYILNGNKIFITNGASADVFIVFAMTAPDKGVKGISAFIVEKTFEGFEVGKVEDKLGIRASSTAELIFQDCHVPAENLIGSEGRGFSIAMKTLDSGRIGIAAQALGISEGAFSESVNYMKERKQFGRSIAKFQGLQWMLADMDVKIDATRELVRKAVELKESKQPYSVAAARAKLFSAETAMGVTTKAIQIFGGYGYTKDYPVERMFRDAKITEIYEGTSEVQKMIIASAALA
jgi:butyryl-CoA dehydrogenase